MPFRLLDKPWIRDAAERVGWTFAQAAIAAVGSEALAVGIVGGDTSVLRAAGVGGLAAVLSLIKAVGARKVGDRDTAATLRTPKQTRLAEHPAGRQVRAEDLPTFNHYPEDDR